MLSSFRSFCQNNLEEAKYSTAEIFTAKNNYVVEDRMKEIQDIVGKQVTVFIVSGSSNKIKQTYTGIAEMADYPKITDKGKATLITVK